MTNDGQGQTVVGPPGDRPTRPAVTVLHGLNPPTDRTTYVVHMLEMGPAEVTVELFTWRRALRGGYDVLHLHWPETLMRVRQPDLPLRWLGFLLLLLLLRVRRVPLVRTRHNVEPHERGLWGERWMLRLCDRRTDAWIRLNAATPPAPRGLDRLVPHGHYRDVFAGVHRPDPVPGRLLLVGRLRAYKGVRELLALFSGWDRPDVSLRVVGAARSSALVREVEAACAADRRMSADLSFVPDEQMVAEIGAAELVVLPYREMHNSGMLLVALSLDRPVLAPRTPANTAIAAEVGEDWLLQYDGDLTNVVVDAALRAVRSDGRSRRPDLRGREWDRVGEGHYALYLATLDRAKRR